MSAAEPIVPGPAALSEAKAFLRIDGAGEDALIGELIETAAELCEAFIGQMLLARSVEETIAASTAWTRLERVPVTEVVAVAERSEPGAIAATVPDTTRIDIDAQGAGWVRYAGGGLDAGAGLAVAGVWPRLRVTYRAGLASEWSLLPAPLRHGALRLVAHLYAERDAAGQAPPAAVAALWRPYRRMRLR